MSENHRLTIKKGFYTKLAVGVGVYFLLSTVVALDFSDFGGKNIRFYAKWSECGHRPLEGKQNYKKIPTYQPGSIFVLVARSDEMFCTPLEAEKAGYSVSENQWERPHLREEQSRTE